MTVGELERERRNLLPVPSANLRYSSKGLEKAEFASDRPASVRGPQRSTVVNELV